MRLLKKVTYSNYTVGVYRIPKVGIRCYKILKSGKKKLMKCPQKVKKEYGLSGVSGTKKKTSKKSTSKKRRTVKRQRIKGLGIRCRDKKGRFTKCRK